MRLLRWIGHWIAVKICKVFGHAWPYTYYRNMEGVIVKDIMCEMGSGMKQAKTYCGRCGHVRYIKVGS